MEIETILLVDSNENNECTLKIKLCFCIYEWIMWCFDISLLRYYWLL